MLNFSHEIPCPEDRAMRKFLWFSYFHDGDICRIDHNAPEPRAITITVRSALDIDMIYRKLKGTWEEKHAQFEPLLPRVTYLLRFHGVKHFRHVMNDHIWREDEILTTRFKDSPLLHRLQKEGGKPLYHLRAETAHGLLDVVFERFTIRKQEGRVDYRCDWDATIDDWQYRMKDVLRDADDSPDADEYNRDCAQNARLYRLQMAEDYPVLAACARKILQGSCQPSCDAPTYAAHLLGYHGNAGDLPTLTRLYMTPELYPLARQAVLDAMERIQEREAANHE